MSAVVHETEEATLENGWWTVLCPTAGCGARLQAATKAGLTHRLVEHMNAAHPVGH